jgi:hypothetical protein
MGMLSRGWGKPRVPDPDEIIAAQPFGDWLRIGSVEQIPGNKKHGRSAFSVKTDDGRRFELRVCSSTARARAIEGLVHAIPDVLPAFFGRG